MKILFCSLGCDKNLVDTEKMIFLLQKNGHTMTDDEHEAEVIIINTCCFIGDAKMESIQTILEMAAMKEEGCCKALLLAGCMAERYQEEIGTQLPEVDGFVGIHAIDRICELVDQTIAAKNALDVSDTFPIRYLGLSDGVCGAEITDRALTTGGHYAFLKIAEGCDKHCTYCIIPKIRGAYRSVPMEKLLEEAKCLAAQGVRELILVAQETTMYGVDLYGKKMLPELLRRLSKIKDIVWLRLQYCYPEEITPELVAEIRDNPKVCHYIDMPIQHASDAILKRMGRMTNQQQILDKIETLRQEIPDIILRTTLIAGFPGETKQDHEQLMRFIDLVSFDRLGVFTYSAEEDTPAFEMPNPVDEDVKEEWRNELMELQQEISLQLCEEQINRVLSVLVEGYVPQENAYVGRTYMDAPNVDGLIFFSSPEIQLMSGDIVKVKVTGAMEYDLMGEMVNEFAK